MVVSDCEGGHENRAAMTNDMELSHDIGPLHPQLPQFDKKDAIEGYPMYSRFQHLRGSRLLNHNVVPSKAL